MTKTGTREGTKGIDNRREKGGSDKGKDNGVTRRGTRVTRKGQEKGREGQGSDTGTREGTRGLTIGGKREEGTREGTME